MNGKADRTSELILIGDVGGVAEGVVLGQTAATVVFVGFTVQFVGSGLGDHVEQAAGGASKFGSETVGDDLEFLDGLEWNGQFLALERAEIFAEEVVGEVAAIDDQAAVVALL